jgi:hypothetical protein
MFKTRRSGRGSATRGWKNEQPGYHQKTIMLHLFTFQTPILYNNIIT